MEILHQQSVNLERVADLCEIGIQREQRVPRDNGQWHVTDLLEASRLIIKGKTAYPTGLASVPGIASMGRIWETAIDCYMADYAKEQGGVYMPDVVLSKDDIYGSLDGLLSIPSLDEIAVSECKLRFTLNMEIPLDHQRQVRAYCHLAGTSLICYISGHVSTMPPLMQSTLGIIRFTPMSIEENWQGLVNTKKYLESQGVGPVGGC